LDTRSADFLPMVAVNDPSPLRRPVRPRARLCATSPGFSPP